MDFKPKRILILHASAGHGHTKAALALAQAVSLKDPEAEVQVIDALDYFPPWLKKIYVGLYLSLIQWAPQIWGLSYEISDKPLFQGPLRFLRRVFNARFASRLIKKILSDQPDFIFCTHFMPAEVLSNIKRTQSLSSVCVTVITDFLVHRFWVFQEVSG